MMVPTFVALILALSHAAGPTQKVPPRGPVGVVAGAPSIPVTCNFTNPAYAGACVEPANRTAEQKPAAVCQPILDCLNNPFCAKSYCMATTTRQGWELSSAK